MIDLPIVCKSMSILCPGFFKALSTFDVQIYIIIDWGDRIYQMHHCPHSNECLGFDTKFHQIMWLQPLNFLECGVTLHYHYSLLLPDPVL